MANSRPTKRYACAQGELYAICTIGWHSYSENLIDFEDFSTKYDAPYGTDAIQAVQSAKQLPDFQARNEPSETSYIQMGSTVALCNRNWRKLRRHITNAFPSDVLKGKLEAAGEDHYRKSINRNWAETELMLTSATTFITDNAAQLASGGMPATFPPEFDAQKNLFFNLYGTFTDAEQDETEGTDVKINANNAIYDTLMSMFEDGQVIYEENPAKRERFIFARVKELITNSVTNGSNTVPADTVELGVYVFDEDTLEPIEGVTLTVFNAPGAMVISAVSDAMGIISLKVTGFAPNETVTLQAELSAPQYANNGGEIEVTAGNYYSVEAEMQREAP